MHRKGPGGGCRLCWTVSSLSDQRVGDREGLQGEAGGWLGACSRGSEHSVEGFVVNLVERPNGAWCSGPWWCFGARK